MVAVVFSQQMIYRQGRSLPLQQTEQASTTFSWLCAVPHRRVDDHETTRTGEARTGEAGKEKKIEQASATLSPELQPAASKMP